MRGISPMRFDTDLHAGMGESFATNTFMIVRFALRREMLMALNRLWDKDTNAVGMKSSLTRSATSAFWMPWRPSAKLKGSTERPPVAAILKAFRQRCRL